MKITIENVLAVRPEDFWSRLFFDPAYNEGLYRELGFRRYEVLALTRHQDGRIERKLRAEPPLRGPRVLQQALRGRLYYDELGTYDPARSVWEFVNETSVAAGTTKVAGTISVAPHAEGLLHTVTLEVRVHALGFGGLVERSIADGTRESYRITTAYTNAFAAEHGLSPAQ